MFHVTYSFEAIIHKELKKKYDKIKNISSVVIATYFPKYQHSLRSKHTA
jgi:hypothetical protein